MRIILVTLLLAVMCCSAWAKEPSWQERVAMAEHQFNKLTKEHRVIYNLVNAMALKQLGQKEYNRIIHRLMEEEANEN